MYSKDYWDGYHGRPRSVFTNDREYNEGQRASPSGAIGGGLGAAMFVALFLAAAAFAALYALYYALMAMVTALLLMPAMRLWKANDITFGEAFRASFYALLSFSAGMLAIAACTFLLVYNGIGQGVLKRTFQTAALQVDNMVRTFHPDGLFPDRALQHMHAEATTADAYLPVLALSILFLPGLMLAAVVLSRRFKPSFSGLRGYIRALITAILVVPLGMFIAQTMFALLISWAEPFALADQHIWPGGLVLGLTVIGFALVGGILGTILLYSAFRIREGRNTHLGLGTAFGASFLGLLAYGIVVAAALVFYREGDPLASWLNHVASAPSSWQAALHDLQGWVAALPGFLALQLPALLCCAGIISWRVGAPFQGVMGFVRATALCLPVVVVMVMPAIAIVVHTVADLHDEHIRSLF